MSRIISLLFVIATALTLTEAFLHPSKHRTIATSGVESALNVFGGKKKGPEEDLSFIESRDMTREEMIALNKKNEEIMNMELTMMTGFSLVLSLPILYLCWVAFFSD